MCIYRYYVEEILPKGMDQVMDTDELNALRARVVGATHGEVVELGFGSGLTLPYYPDQVTRVHAVDPSIRGRELAAGRIQSSHADVDFPSPDAQELPFEAHTIDAAVSTWTLCSIPDLQRALRELRRVLKPGGTFHFVEHGLADDHRVARWQRRLNWAQKLYAGGCTLTTRIDAELEAAGFEIQRLDTFYTTGRRIQTFTFEGVAVSR